MDSIWYETLVIVLGTFLALFLILGILLLVKILQIVKTVKKIIERAEQVADKAEHITAFFKKTATPVALFKLVSNMSDLYKKRGRKK